LIQQIYKLFLNITNFSATFFLFFFFPHQLARCCCFQRAICRIFHIYRRPFYGWYFLLYSKTVPFLMPRLRFQKISFPQEFHLHLFYSVTYIFVSPCLSWISNQISFYQISCQSFFILQIFAIKKPLIQFFLRLGNFSEVGNMLWLETYVLLCSTSYRSFPFTPKVPIFSW